MCTVQSWGLSRVHFYYPHTKRRVGRSFRYAHLHYLSHKLNPTCFCLCGYLESHFISQRKAKWFQDKTENHADTSWLGPDITKAWEETVVTDPGKEGALFPVTFALICDHASSFPESLKFQGVHYLGFGWLTHRMEFFIVLPLISVFFRVPKHDLFQLPWLVLIHMFP